jgi:DNA-binding transcriptional LysR family regulator
MNTKNLYYFLVVAEELNMTRAAERLYISQQALSEQIRKLEDELKAELFTRGHSLSLTYAGRHMVDTATQMLSLERQIKNGLSTSPTTAAANWF